MSKHFVIVGGHSDKSTGAVGNGYKELEENYFMADKIRWFLKDRWLCTAVNDSRSVHSGGGEEEFILKENPIYFLSVHFNAGGGTGCECLVPVRETVTILEERILDGMVKLGFKSRGVKRREYDKGFVNAPISNGKDYYGIFRNTNGRSGALIEICFIDNAEDMKLYKAKWRDIAIMIADNIGKAYGLSENPDSQSRPKPEPPKPVEMIEKSKYDELNNKYVAVCKERDSLKVEVSKLNETIDELTSKPNNADEALVRLDEVMLDIEDIRHLLLQ